MCLSVCSCVTFVVFTVCESCTRPTSTNRGSIEAGECGLTREVRFVARRLEVVSVAGSCGFRGVFWVRRDHFFRLLFVFFFERNAHRLLQV